MLTSSKDALALAVLVGVLGCDLSLAGGVGQREHQRLLHMLAHLLNHFLQPPYHNNFWEKSCTGHSPLLCGWDLNLGVSSRGTGCKLPSAVDRSMTLYMICDTSLVMLAVCIHL